ncbi:MULTISPECIES: AarF/ABC1/UbiB kinase family protein [unclassified Coleofasciculus]|uniref:ABC1 kinase family protein n=2 Tax=Cyanobacteriota TaxID=1117 RepID=UPI001687806A|nr:MULTISPECIES: AarF/ABC1/UbiB kinase family protein [unclassified Coleofasciculus]MBD1888667.1 AarF/ABC1/UbiB kinase family protein [Coleofasciculus sp. FACHB-SPT9]MBD1896527.1 AarF/ABC1/UbiB kinase family protein [Coleofasciculus sp. FACHB-129]MBD2084664.1 AarF/ABC1/UbiB kinase family protein [Coleofasciculus sp. FACHB-542]MBD2537398.1 AarF/ABC1/UbiB kinase family protein [Coleofasciculus sp. FACHB-SPT36]
MNVKRVSPMSHRTDASDRISTTGVMKPAQTASAAPGEAVVVEYELTPTAEQYPAAVDAQTAYIQAEELRYDPVAITDYYRRRPFQVWGRLFNILVPILRFGLSLWWDKQTGSVPKNERKRAIRLRTIITRLGPAYIKVGQALSTRPDLVPTTYLDELSHLQDQLPPFPNELAYRFIEEELGDRPEQIYAELSPTPVAAASLGQVYKGKLKTGETVAVKVQRPGLRENIALDIYILRTLAGWAQRNLKQVRSDLVSIMDEFGTRIYEEMDYTQEGHNAERFASLYGHLQDIYIPKIYWEYTQRRVLTMEWINGTKLTQPEALRAQGIDAVHLIEVGVQCSLRQLLEHGFFHADPHPGNLLATTDGQLAYLDFGMMSDVKPYQRYGLIEAVVHMVNRDFEGLARDYVNLEFLTPDTDLAPIIPALSKVFSNALGASVAEMNFKSITDDMSALMYEYPFRVPAYYALIIRSLVTLEGIAINVDPNFKVLSKAYPYVAKRLLTDPSPELRASLRDLLFKDGSFRWNRLENLLKNARFSDDYDLTQVLNQTLDFLFSERGAFIREHLTDEIVKGIDSLGRRTFQNVTYSLRERVGMTVNEAPPSAETPASLEHIKRIWDILQETSGFDAMQLLPVIPQLLMKPETQRMGQKIAGGLVQRVAARLIRDVLLQDAPPKASQNGHTPRTYPPTSPRLALPPAAAR